MHFLPVGRIFAGVMNACPMPLLEKFELVGDILALRWSDGSENYVAARRLREGCPCAACRGEPSLTQLPQSRCAGPPSAAGTTIVAIEPVGAYGLSPRWADGHATGIYSYPLLRRLAGDEAAGAADG